MTAVRRFSLGDTGWSVWRAGVLRTTGFPVDGLDALAAPEVAAGALGVVCAHSGTMLGVLLADDDPGYARRLALVRAACARLSPRVSLFRSRPVNELELLDAV